MCTSSCFVKLDQYLCINSPFLLLVGSIAYHKLVHLFPFQVTDIVTSADGWIYIDALLDCSKVCVLSCYFTFFLCIAMSCMCMCTVLITNSACHTSMKCSGNKWSRVLGTKMLECKENVKIACVLGQNCYPYFCVLGTQTLLQCRTGQPVRERGNRS